MNQGSRKISTHRTLVMQVAPPATVSATTSNIRLPPSVDYSTLATFRRSIDGIDFTSSLKCDTD